ncbi:Uncharacterized protein SCF082_LOCUS42208, partial [Durusdinium trenchii]
AWGKAFGDQLEGIGTERVICLMNFSIKAETDGSVCLTGEYAGTSARGSAFIVVPEASEVLELFKEVEVEGGEAISSPWQPSGPTTMSPDGPCFTSCIASVRNSSLAWGDDALQPVASQRGKAGGGVPAPPEVWLPEVVRVFICGAWLSDVRDAEIMYRPCTVCKKKVPEGSEWCAQMDCTGKASADKTVFTAVSISDFTGCLQHVLIRTTEFLQFTGFADLTALEQCLVSEGHMSLPFRARADIILGSQRATTYGATTVANFEVLKAQMGHILPIASLHDFEKTPVGLRHKPTKSTPEQITMVIAAKDKPKPEIFDGHILADMFVYNMGDGKPRYVVGTVRAVSDKSLVLVVSRTFALEMDAEQAAKLHADEIQHAGAVQIRKGSKQKAEALMAQTPMKKPYLGPA